MQVQKGRDQVSGKVICKFQLNMSKYGVRKVRNAVYYQYFKVEKEHNSFKNWRKLMKLKLDMYICSTVKQRHMQTFSLICLTGVFPVFLVPKGA